mgnify:CR=1 FL=1
MAKKYSVTSNRKFGVAQLILLICLLIFTVFCFAPVVLVFISAFTDEVYITQHGFSFFPTQWSRRSLAIFTTTLQPSCCPR